MEVEAEERVEEKVELGAGSGGGAGTVALAKGGVPAFALPTPMLLRRASFALSCTCV